MQNRLNPPPRRGRTLQERVLAARAELARQDRALLDCADELGIELRVVGPSEASLPIGLHFRGWMA